MIPHFPRLFRKGGYYVPRKLTGSKEKIVDEEHVDLHTLYSQACTRTSTMQSDVEREGEQP